VPDPDPPPLKSSPLSALHAELGARMVPFAGWSLPVQYPAGIIAEHRQCRERAALFDVSHMGQASLHGPGAVQALETLAVGDLAGLRPGRQRYSLLTTDSGGIVDDFMVANLGDRLFLVVNASRAAFDFARIESALPAGVRLDRHPDRALLALQGPLAASVMARISPSPRGRGPGGGGTTAPTPAATPSPNPLPQGEGEGLFLAGSVATKQ
jgi:aminomethyltransferase